MLAAAACGPGAFVLRAVRPVSRQRRGALEAARSWCPAPVIWQLRQAVASAGVVIGRFVRYALPGRFSRKEHPPWLWARSATPRCGRTRSRIGRSTARNSWGCNSFERTRSALRFRMDDRKQRIVISSEETAGNVFGWEVADAAALDALAARLESAGIGVERAPAAIASLRGVRDLIRFQDPAGNRLEAFHGAEIADAPFVPGRPISGFRTGTLGMGHVVLHVEERGGPALVLRGRAGLRFERLQSQAVQGLFLPPQPAPPQPRHDRDGPRRHPSHHDGALQPGRRGPGLRHRLRRAGGAHRHDARAAHQRFHDLVLRPHAQ